MCKHLVKTYQSFETPKAHLNTWHHDIILLGVQAKNFPVFDESPPSALSFNPQTLASKYF